MSIIILMSDEQQEIRKYQFLRSVMDFDLLALVLLMLRSVLDSFLKWMTHNLLFSSDIQSKSANLSKSAIDLHEI